MSISELIPMSSPDLTEAERQAVAAVLETPTLSMGNQIEALEESMRGRLDCRHAIAISSGTAGLHMCVRAAGIGPQDLVITTPFSFVASANVLLFEQAIPVFVDVDPVTGNIDSQLVHQAALDLASGGSATRHWLPRKNAVQAGALKAVLPVDVFGQPVDMDAILPTARAFNLKIIEDSCEALGAEYKNRKAGTLGDYGVFGFYPNKQITTGEGGLIVTDDDQAAEMMRALRNQGRSPGDTWLQHTYLGYNYRLDEMSAALGRVQLERLDEMLQRRSAVADLYREMLASLTELQCQELSPHTTRMSWFVFVVRFAPHIDRDNVAAELKKNGIPARPYFTPIHLQPYMVERFDFRLGDFPVTEELGKRSLALPFSSVMTAEQVERVCTTLSKILA